MFIHVFVEPMHATLLLERFSKILMLSQVSRSVIDVGATVCDTCACYTVIGGVVQGCTNTAYSMHSSTSLLVFMPCGRACGTQQL